MVLSKAEREKLFNERARKMKEAHVVSLEIFIGRICPNNQLSEIIAKNCDIVKMRVKFGNFPCTEIPGTYEEEYVPVITPTIRTLFNVDLPDNGSVEDLSEEQIMDGEQKKSKKKKVPPRFDENWYLSGPKKTLHTETEECIIRRIKEEKERLRNEKDHDKKSDVDEEEEMLSVLDNKQVILGSELILLKKGDGIPFNDCCTMIFPITPHQLLYTLVNKPLKLFLILKPSDKDAFILGTCDISMYSTSDIVSHMISVEGGVLATSTIQGTFYISDPKNVLSSLGTIKIKLEISTHGIGCCSTMSWIEKDDAKIILDEWVEDQVNPVIPILERDVSPAIPIMTGSEHTSILMPDIPILPKPANTGCTLHCNCCPKINYKTQTNLKLQKY